MLRLLGLACALFLFTGLVSVTLAHAAVIAALAAAAFCAAMLVASGGSPTAAPEPESTETHTEGTIALAPEQITAAGIAPVQPPNGDAGAAIEASALLESDPDASVSSLRPDREPR